MAVTAPSLEESNAALDAGEWTRALDGFDAILTLRRDPEALDGSARALWWLGRAAEAIDRRRDAYASFRKRGALERAARIAMWLAHEQAVQGNDAVARGWFARAERICAELPPSPVHGWLALARTERTDDPSLMEREANEALTIAHEQKDPDLEIRALARLGLALVSLAQVDAGAARFDEAMAAATGGEAFGLDVLGETYCDMFLAIEIAGDDGGFNQWSGVIMEFLGKTQHAPGLAFCGSCCGELFAAAGKFDVAESEMMRALRELTAQGQRARCVHPAAKLAELRVMQGRFEDAERLLEGYEGVAETVRARVALALARGEFAVAAALLERRLNSLGADSLLSVPLLSQLAEVRVAKGDLEGARSIAGRLSSLAQATGHRRVEAEAARAAGRVSMAAGEVSAARSSLERALDLFAKLSKPIEEARTRMARDLGGAVERTGASEFGRTDLRAGGGALLEQTPEEQVVWMSHRDSVTAAPEGAEVTASSPSTPIAAFEAPGRGLYGVQFHPEVVHTAFGNEVLKNFLYGVAEAPPTWTAAAVIEEQVERIRAQVGSERVLCALSGGVDSAVAALLVHKAVGDQLTCVFVDHGLLRKDEATQVVETFRGHFHVPLVHVEAEERFLARLEGVDDPEEKRKRVGEEFIRVFEEEARRLGRIRYLVQGTLYSDVIESGGTDGVAAMIKSHHNVGGLPEDVDFDLVEPLRLLFKDEVRRVGEELGLPERMVWRQPFPGPGLAIRIIGEVTHERLEILRAADAILQEEVRRAGLYRDLWQSFAVLPAIRSVGVQGDERTYAYPIVIRAVTSEDAMTADWARLPYDLLETISGRIINEIPGVNRVALDISSKPPSTIEWE